MQRHFPKQRSPSDDDDDDEVQSDAESHMPSDAPDKTVDQAYFWFFEMALVVGEEHIVDEKISPKIVEDVFKARDYGCDCALTTWPESGGDINTTLAE